jgi:hypothetical protein
VSVAPTFQDVIKSAVKQQFADAGAFECSDGLARKIVHQARNSELRRGAGSITD